MSGLGSSFLLGLSDSSFFLRNLLLVVIVGKNLGVDFSSDEKHSKNHQDSGDEDDDAVPHEALSV